MKELKKIAYTILASLVLLLVLTNSLLDLSYSTFFLVCLALGLFLAYAYKELDSEEKLDPISLFYLPAAAITIVVGTISNIILSILTIAVRQFHALATSTANELAKASMSANETLISMLSNQITYRIIPIELLLLTIGIFGPMLVLQYYKKEKIPWADLLWDIFIVIVLCVIAFFIEQIVMNNIIARSL